MRLLAAILLFPFLFSAAAEAGDGEGAAVYKRCAACHLPSRAGVPGTFPPLDDHIAAMAESDAGREYLVAAVSRGVIGEIDVHGVTYRGMMPPQGGLTDQQLVAVLNFLIEGGEAAPYTPDEVARLRTKHARTTAQQVRALRDLAVQTEATAKP